MSDRLLWLEQSCPYCLAAPGARCSLWPIQYRERTKARSRVLHVSRGWLERPCPICTATAGQGCVTPSGRPATRPHSARLGPGRFELVSYELVWAELEQSDISIVIVRFSGSAGGGGAVEQPDFVGIDRLQVAATHWATEELRAALQAPIWGRFGTFSGLPQTRGELVWSVGARRLVVQGRRGDARLEEALV